MSGLGIYRDEIDILYAASNKLTQAFTPVEQLEAISDYPRESGASWGMLYYAEDHHDAETHWLECVASWAKEPAQPVPTGSRIEIAKLNLANAARSTTRFTVSTLIGDVCSDSRVDPVMLETYTHYGQRAVVLLPLYTNGRYIGLAQFCWSEPRLFDEYDQRIYSALIRQMVAVVNATLLFEQTQRRATELETAKSEIDLLYAASNKLTRASTSEEFLEAISEYARERGASAGTMLAIALDPQTQKPLYWQALASWRTDQRPATVPGTRFLEDLPELIERWLNDISDAVVLIPDIATFEVMDPRQRALHLAVGTRGLAVLQLLNKSRFTGTILFAWDQPFVFNERDERVFTALVQQAAPVIDSVRLFEQTQRRATELESAKNEIDILYAASNKLNRAATPDALLAALSDYARERGAVLGALLSTEVDSLSGKALYAEVLASWRTDQYPPLLLGTKTFVEHPEVLDAWNAYDSAVVFVKDVDAYAYYADESVPAFFKSLHLQAVAMLQLRNKSRIAGTVLFGWQQPFRFEQRDSRIFTALAQQAAPVVDSMRLFEQTQRRATELEIAKSEIDILYAASNRLTRASTSEEFLDSVSDYARERGAAMGMLFSVSANYPEKVPLDPQLITYWKTSEESLAGIDDWFIDDREPEFYDFFIGDYTLILVDRRAAKEAEAHHWYKMYQDMGVHAFAILKLKNQSRLTNIVLFCWDTEILFDERDMRLFRTLALQAAPVIDSILLFEQNRERAARAEHLLTINMALSQATDEIQIVDAIARYTQLKGADSIVLNYMDLDANGEPVDSYIVAVWYDGKAEPYAPDRHPLVKLSSFKYYELWYEHPDEVLLIENIETDTRIIPEQRSAMLSAIRSRAMATLPLFNGGRCQGVLNINWFEPHHFSDEEKYIYANLLQTLPAIVATRRAYLAAESLREENEALYRVGQVINAAHTFSEIMRAVELLHLINCFGIMLGTWENFDFEGANYLEIRALSGPLHWKVGERPHRSEMTLSFQAKGGTLLTVEDIRTLDNGAARRAQAVGVKSMVLVPVTLKERFVGTLMFYFDQARKFTEREKRLMAGVGDLVAAAVERIRLQTFTEQARTENETLYRVGQVINAAKSYAEIMQAVERLELINYFGIMLGTWENFDFEAASYLEVRAVSGSVHWQVGMRPAHDDLPVAFRPNGDAPVIVENFAALAGETPKRAIQMGVQSMVLIPITLNHRFMGTLTFYFSQERTFSERETRIMAGVGDLVAAAIERIRLQSFTEQERQNAEMLAQINAALSQAIDEQAILAAVAGLAERYGTSLSMLSYVEPGGNLNIVALRSGDGSTPLPLSFLPITTFRLKDYPILGLAYTRDEIMFLEDAVRDKHIPESAREFAQRMNWQATIMIPLKIAEQGQGILSFAWSTPQVFTQEMRSLFTAIRPTAASVVSSRRAYLAQEEARRESEQRAHELETVAKVSAAAASILDVNELLDTVAYLTSISFNDYHIFIYLLDEIEENLVLAENPLDDYATSGQQIPLRHAHSLVARAAQTRQGIIVNDIANEPEYTLTPLLRDACSEMAVPMIAAERLIGVLDVQATQVERFTETDIRVMSTLADMIAVAVQNAKLYEQAQELAALEERNRLARELHDSVSQALYGIGLGARTARKLLERDPSRLAEPLDYITSLAEAGLTEMRALIFELRPESLENEGLVMALEKQAAALYARHGIKVQTEFPQAEPMLPLDIKEALYSVAREALHNILKHAQARHVNLILRINEDHILLEIHDDGIGFDTSSSFPGHLGLHSMRERAERARGTFTVTSAPGAGTQLVVNIPLSH